MTVGWLAGNTADAEVIFHDKTITMLIGSETGGGTDAVGLVVEAGRDRGVVPVAQLEALSRGRVRDGHLLDAAVHPERRVAGRGGGGREGAQVGVRAARDERRARWREAARR